MNASWSVVAVLAGVAFAGPALGQPEKPGEAMAAPSAPPPAAPTAAPQPPYAYPPGYAYPPPGGYAPGGYPPGSYDPGYGYPPAYAYPPGYGPYPQGYPGSTPAPSVAKPTPPFVGPTGKLRLGANLAAFVHGKLNYNLIFRGESLVPHSGSAAASPGVTVFAEYQLMRFVFVGLSVQYLTTVKWTQRANLASFPSSASDLYGGSGGEIDLLPRLGISYALTSWLRFVTSAAAGYSMLDASDMVRVYANPGTMTGFTLQGDAGMLASFSQHGFAQLRLSYQSSHLENSTTSNTTGETATADLRANYWGIAGGMGFWF